MSFKNHIKILTVYSLIFAPGCKQRETSELESISDKKSSQDSSYTTTESYKKLSDDQVNGVLDKVFAAAKSEVSERKLILIRVDENNGRQIATGGLDEYWNHAYPGSRYFFVDQLEKPSVAITVKPKLIEGRTIVLELIEHDPSSFEIVDYQPLFIELSNSDKSSVAKNVGQVQRALNSFAQSVSENSLEAAKETAEPGSYLEPDQVDMLVKGVIIAAVGAAVGWVLAAALKKQNEGKFSWGLVIGTAAVGVAVFMIILYSSYDEEEFEVPEGKPEDDKIDETITSVVSERTWEYISISR